MKITKVYTKTGDKGMTSLVGGVRISKADIRLEAYGTVDELNSNIGLLATEVRDEGILETLYRIQSNLFNVGTHLATDQDKTPLYESAKLCDGEVELIEGEIDKTLSELPETMGFVLPGGGRAGALAHVCRTVCRRAERAIDAVAEERTINPDVLAFMNRFSDYLFVLARKLNFIAHKEEKRWNKTCR